uniref:Uncharacterized protein n=1 Tax=Rhizophora mucronata TaxID=61149 RepID=A0A2P2Q738_RHIMU
MWGQLQKRSIQILFTSPAHLGQEALILKPNAKYQGLRQNEQPLFFPLPLVLMIKAC